MNILQDTLRPCIHQRAVESAGRIKMLFDLFHSNTQPCNEKTAAELLRPSIEKTGHLRKIMSQIMK